MKKDTIEQFAEDIENLRRKVAKAKSEEKTKISSPRKKTGSNSGLTLTKGKDNG